MAVGINFPTSLGLPTQQGIEGYVEGWSPDVAAFIGITQLLGISNEYLPYARWDEKGVISGMTAPNVSGVAPSKVKQRTLKTMREDPILFEEEGELFADDFLNARAAGTIDQNAGFQLVTDMTDQLQTRLDIRMEYNCWQALQGQLVVNENGVIRTITYSANFAGTPTAGTLWSDIANADILGNLQAWTKLFRGKGTGKPRLFASRTAFEYMSNNTKIQNLVNKNNTALQLGFDTVATLVAPLCGGIQSLNLYDEGYIDSSGTWQPFIADNKIVLISNPVKGQLLGKTGLFPNVRKGGENPQPGRSIQVFNELQNQRIPRYSQITSVITIPMIQQPQCILVATIA